MDFVKDLKVQLFIIENSMNLNNFEGESLKKIQLLISDNALFFRNEIPKQYISISKTNFKSFESVTIDALENKSYEHYFYGLDRIINNIESRVGDTLLLDLKF